MKTLVVVVVMGLVGCKRAQPEQVFMPPAPVGSGSASVAAVVGGPGSTPSDAEILAAVPPAVGFTYFATKGGNHPALFLDPARDAFVVVGRAASLGERPAPEQVVQVHHDQAVGIARRRRRHALGQVADGDELRLVGGERVVELAAREHLLGSSEPSDAAGQVLYRTRPTDAWVAFAAHGAPALAAGGDGLNVIGPKGLATHPWSQSNQAIVAFRALVK